MILVDVVRDPQFWAGIVQISLIDMVLSGDNAVVIALAARALAPAQQRRVVIWGAAAAVTMRIALTVVAVQMLQWPYLKSIGAVLLFWIAARLLVPQAGHGEVSSAKSMSSAIKTILMADLVMSLDNVIGVAAAAKGDLTLLIFGLALSIPIVVFGATILMRFMERWPIIITIGAALLGWVAAEMVVTDPAWGGAHSAAFSWLSLRIGAFELNWLQLLGATLVVVIGKTLARRAAVTTTHPPVDLAADDAHNHPHD